MTSVAKLRDVFEVNVFFASADNAIGGKTDDEAEVRMHN